MFPAILTAFFFSFSGVCASRSTRLIGSIKANFYRLVFGFCCLALYAYVLGQGHRGPGLVWFMLSGAIGVGLGDTATFLAIKRIGPRLSVMLVQCLTAPIGAAVEWIWLGTKLTPFQLLGSAIILCGSGLALWPKRKIEIPPELLRAGILFGTLGALGQALGAVITRKANEMNEAIHLNINGMTAAYQRMLGALFVGILIYCSIELLRRRTYSNLTLPAAAYKKVAPWTVLNAMSGLVLGISCYQWALQYTATGIVLAIVATTPLIVMPMAYFLDNDRPSRRAMLGGVIAVAGVLIIKFCG
jgi:drug/metabolite transporter (DMT)-like permease